MSNKSVKQECFTKRCAIVSGKGVLQECHLSVSSQGVPQVGSLENVMNKYCPVPQHTCRHWGSWASSCFSGGNMTTHGGKMTTARVKSNVNLQVYVDITMKAAKENDAVTRCKKKGFRIS